MKKERIARQVGMERARYFQDGYFPFHFSRILRAKHNISDSLPQFTICDTADSKACFVPSLRDGVGRENL